MKRRIGLVFAVIAIGISAGAVNAFASGPYSSGTTGYDVSYPNCGVTPPGAFAIVGVNGGRPFSSNSCLGAEYTAAPQSPLPSLYINTGYSGAYRKSITSGCSGRVVAVTGSNAQKQAWAIGCSEADTSISYAARSASMWWVDVESGNSWSTSNTSLNRYTIQGAVDRLGQVNAYVGVYSTASMWNTITGSTTGTSFTPNGIVADWVAAGSCTTPFTGNKPVWLQQSTSGGLDSDYAC